MKETCACWLASPASSATSTPAASPPPGSATSRCTTALRRRRPALRPLYLPGLPRRQDAAHLLATGSAIFSLRHPIDLAKSAATIDQLSGGRLVMGIASGDRPIEFPAYGLQHDQRAERFAAVADFRRLLQPGRRALTSPLGHITDAELLPKPAAGPIPCSSPAPAANPRTGSPHTPTAGSRTPARPSSPQAPRSWARKSRPGATASLTAASALTPPTNG